VAAAAAAAAAATTTAAAAEAALICFVYVAPRIIPSAIAIGIVVQEKNVKTAVICEQ
jgi:hypothetical protein